MSRTLLNRIHDLLGPSGLRGELLAEALERAGREHTAPAFRTCLGLVSGRPRSESEAREALRAIETHRGLLEARLGRDPGFLVAAVDHLGVSEGVGGRRPAASAGPPATAEAPFDDRLEAELRRSERTGRPLVLALLAPREPVEELSIEAAAAALKRARRDVDVVTRLVPAGFAMILPSVGRSAGERAAARLSEVAGRASGVEWCVGLAERDAAEPGIDGLAAAALRALRLAKSGDRAIRVAQPERRRRRRASGTGLRARIEAPLPARPAGVVDLSASGLRLHGAPGLREGEAVTIELRGPAPRRSTAKVRGHVLRREPSALEGSAVLLLDGAEDASPDLAALLAGLPVLSWEGSA
jgi:PilZ domain-containing protein